MVGVSRPGRRDVPASWSAARPLVLITTVMLLLAALAVVPASANGGCSDAGHSTYGGGAGTSGDPFLIATVVHLQTLRDRVNVDVAGSEQEQCYFRQTADLDLSGISSWVAIGTDTSGGNRTKFLGHYDGDFHRVQNLTIDTADSSVRYYGLFGYVRHGSVKNLRLTNVDIDLAFTGQTTFQYVGGLVGFLDSSDANSPDTVLMTVSVQGTVEVDYSGSEWVFVGGVVGRGGEHGRINDRIAFVGDVGGVFATTNSGAEGNYGGLVGRSSWDNSVSLGYAAANVTVIRGAGNVGDITVGVLVGSSSTNPSVLEELYAVGSARVLGEGGGTAYVGAVGWIGDELDEFRDIYWLDSIGSFAGGAHEDFPSGSGGLFNVVSRTDAQMRLAQPATTMTTGTVGSGRWVYNNEPGNAIPGGKWYLVLAPSAGTYPYPVFFWEIDAVPAGTSIIDQQSGWVLANAPASDLSGPVGPQLACTPHDPTVGVTVTCTVTGGDAGIDILWRAAYNPVFAGAGVTLDASGAGTFSFVVPAAAFGQPITVELVDWAAPMSLGVAGGPVPTSVPSGEGPVPVWTLGLLVLFGLALLRRGPSSSSAIGRQDF